MLQDSKKISIRQAILIFLAVIFSPAVRIIPAYSAKHAKEAAWLAPVVSAIMLALLVIVWQILYKKQKTSSLMQIYTDVAGKFIGKVLSFAYLIWIIILASLYARYFGIKMTGTIYPDIQIGIFIVSILIVAMYALRFGAVMLGRLSEVVFPLLAIIFAILFILLLPYVKVKFLTPITYRSIIPAINAGLGIAGILAYFTFIFIIGDSINNKENIRKEGLKSTLFLLICIMCFIIGTVGTLSHTVVSRMNFPFFSSVKQISLFNTLEKMESIVVVFWIASDFALICFFALLALHLMKSLFNFSDEKPLLGIFAIFIYFLSMYLANSVFELERLSNHFIIPGNIFLGYILPITMLIIGKIRKKV